MDNFIGILGTTITVLSFIYAIYENRRHAKLVKYNREQAWEIYRQASCILGFYQELEKIQTNDIKMRDYIAKGEAVTQELLTNGIRMIKRFEKRFDSKAIDEWLDKGLLPNDTHVKAFKHYV